LPRHQRSLFSVAAEGVMSVTALTRMCSVPLVSVHLHGAKDQGDLQLKYVLQVK
jgi:hypothetical protein